MAVSFLLSLLRRNSLALDGVGARFHCVNGTECVCLIVSQISMLCVSTHREIAKDPNVGCSMVQGLISETYLSK